MVVAVSVGRRGKGLLRVHFQRVTLFESVKKIEKLHFQLDRREQSHHHRFTELQQRRPVDLVVSEDFLEGGQVRFA